MTNPIPDCPQPEYPIRERAYTPEQEAALGRASLRPEMVKAKVKDDEADLPLIVGHTYEAKRPRTVGLFPRLVDDRLILWVSIAEVQYDSPAVSNGRKYPKVTHEQFRRWAGRDVTAEMPNDEWRNADKPA